MLNPDDRPSLTAMADSMWKPSPQVLARRLPGGAVLVHLTTNRIFEVNETGAVVWELLTAGRSRDEVLTELVATFEVDRDQAAAGFERITAELRREGLLSPS